MLKRPVQAKGECLQADFQTPRRPRPFKGKRFFIHTRHRGQGQGEECVVYFPSLSCLPRRRRRKLCAQRLDGPTLRTSGRSPKTYRRKRWSARGPHERVWLRLRRPELGQRRRPCGFRKHLRGDERLRGKGERGRLLEVRCWLRLRARYRARRRARRRGPPSRGGAMLTTRSARMRARTQWARRTIGAYVRMAPHIHRLSGRRSAPKCSDESEPPISLVTLPARTFDVTAARRSRAAPKGELQRVTDHPPKRTWPHYREADAGSACAPTCVGGLGGASTVHGVLPVGGSNLS